MAMYSCRTSDSSGRIRENVFEAASEDILLRDLSSQNLYPLEIRKLDDASRATAVRGKLKRRVIMDFTDGLSLMLASGVSLKDAMNVLAASVSGKKSGTFSRIVSDGIAKGRSFSEALEPFASSFGTVYRGLVRTGERIGTLEDVISRLSEYLHEEKKIRDRAVNALIYPALVLGVAVVGTALIAAFVLPAMKEMFSELGGEYGERIDSAVGTMTAVLSVFLAVVSTGIAGAATASVLRRKNEDFAARTDAYLFRMPVLGAYRLRRDLMNFAFSMEILTANGIPVEESLTEAAGSQKSVLFRREIASVRKAVERGERLSSAFGRSGFFPGRIATWLATGEQTGRVEKVFSHIRKTYQSELENISARFMTLVEPAVILLMGVMLVALILTFIIPLFSMFGSLL